MFFIYISLFILVFDLSLTPYASSLIFAVVSVPIGYRALFIFLLILCLFAWLMIFTRKRVFFDLWNVAKYWIPWIIYLAIRTNFTDNGLWKLEMYLVKVFFPCMILAAMYIANKTLFEKYFMNTFLSINIVMLIYLFLFHRTYNDPGAFDRNIWLSRSLGICIFYYLISFRFSKKAFFIVPVIVLFAVAMLIIGSRGPVLSLLLTMTTFFCLKFRKNIGALAISFTISFIIILFFVYLPSFSKAFKTFATHGKTKEITQAVQGRTNIYVPTLKIFISHPIVGAGFANWWDEFRNRFLYKNSSYANSFKSKGQRDYTYPHNMLLEILSELGVLGIMFFSMLFWPYRRLFNLNNKFNYLILLGFLYSLSSSDITQNAAPMIFNILSVTYVITYFDNEKTDNR